MEINNATEASASNSVSYQKSILLRGNMTAEISPAKNWRELALKGVKSLKYRISATGLVGDQIRHLNVYLPALADSEICGLGAGVPHGKTEAIEIVRALCPKMSKLDSASMMVDAEGKTVLEDGLPVFTEAPIIGADGQPFDFRFGCQYFCPTHSGLTLNLSDCEIHASEGRTLAPDGQPYLNVHCGDYTVVPRETVRAKGSALGLTMTACQQSEAARKTAAAVQDSLGGVL